MLYKRRQITANNPKITAADFRADLPEFDAATYPDASLLGWVAQARKIYNWRKLGIIYLAAHLLSLSESERGVTPATPYAGYSNQIEKMEVGPLSVEYRRGTAGTQSSDEMENVWFFDRTHYGRMYLQLKRGTPGLGFGVRNYG